MDDAKQMIEATAIPASGRSWWRRAWWRRAWRLGGLVSAVALTAGLGWLALQPEPASTCNTARVQTHDAWREAATAIDEARGEAASVRWAEDRLDRARAELAALGREPRAWTERVLADERDPQMARATLTLFPTGGRWQLCGRDCVELDASDVEVARRFQAAETGLRGAEARYWDHRLGASRLAARATEPALAYRRAVSGFRENAYGPILTLPAVRRALAASDASFEACRDVDP